MPSVLHEGDPGCKKTKILSPTPLAFRSASVLCSPHNRPVNLRDEVSRQGIVTLLGELADREDGKLMSQNNHLTWVWMPCSFMDQR